MLGPAGHEQTATGVSIANRAAQRARPPVRESALVTAALLSLALGIALYKGLTGEHSSPAPAAHHRLAEPQNGLLSLPPTARGPISSALGAEDPAYRVGASRGGFEAANPHHGLHLSFSRSGVLVTSGKTRLGLSLRAAG